MSVPRILIVGGSTRAAADSVRRAGWQPVCADLFADLDLRSTAEIAPVRRYPQSLAQDVAAVRADGWFYCGALENHPEIIASLLERQDSYGPLLGTRPEALEQVRDPKWLEVTLRAAGLPALEVALQSAPPIADGSWLQKPMASAGGRAIRVWDRTASWIPFLESHYFQRRVAGEKLSAIFRMDDRGVHWLGASRELDSAPTSSAPSEFSYCGSIGPLQRIPESTQRHLTKIAEVVVGRSPGLRGIIGLDFRLLNGQVWMTEVNPRYTASIEVLELASGRSLLNDAARDHLSRDKRLANIDQINAASISPTSELRESSHSEERHRSISAGFVVAKQILYAATRLTAPDLVRYLSGGDPWHVPIIADIPLSGTIIEPGWPICTVLAAGPEISTVESLLARRREMIRAELGTSE